MDRLSFVHFCFLMVAAGTLARAQTTTPATMTANWAAREGEEWKSIDMSQLAVAPESALDFSRFIETPAGKHGRIVIGSDGHFTYENMPETRLRFHGATIHPLRELGEYKDHAAIERLGAQLRRQGYNFVRIMSLDLFLMDGSTTPLVFNPERVDSFQYLIRCLKENGIYVLLDAMTSSTGYTMGGGVSNEEMAKRFNYKMGMYYDEDSRQHWKQGLGQILTYKSPYTGLTLNEEPALMGLTCFNEQNLYFAHKWLSTKRDLTVLGPLWHEWLKERYQSMDALRTEWKGAGEDVLPAVAKDFSDIPVFTAEWSLHKGAWARDVGLFMQARYWDLYQYFEKTAREIGFKGIVMHYDWIKQLDIAAIRNRLPGVAVHTYFTHPAGYVEPGARVTQKSSITDEAEYFYSMFGSRYVGRPFLVTEYGHVFWNKFRYESGLLFGAYSSLQDLDGFNEHSGPVSESARSGMRPFRIAIDPVARACHVLGAFMLLRGDIQPFSKYVEVRLRDKFLFEDVNYPNALSTTQTKFSFITGFGVSYPDDEKPAWKAKKTPDYVMDPFGWSETKTHAFYDEVLDEKQSLDLARKALQEMKDKGLVPQSNRTDFDRGIFESDTGQINLVRDQRLFTVDAPRLQGACIDPQAGVGPVQLSSISVESVSAMGCVAAVAVDDLALGESNRILLLYITDALNSGMSFTDATRETLVDIGDRPTLMRAGNLKLAIENRNASRLRLWALGMDGTRKQELPVSAEGNRLTVAIDVGKLEGGPTPYFELVGEGH